MKAIRSGTRRTTFWGGGTRGVARGDLPPGDRGRDRGDRQPEAEHHYVEPGLRPFGGTVFPVNSRGGRTCSASGISFGFGGAAEGVLAIVGPAPTVPDISRCVEAGVEGAIIISARVSGKCGARGAETRGTGRLAEGQAGRMRIIV